MNIKNNTLNHHPKWESVASQVGPFLAGLEKAGYPANTLSTKRAALRKFLGWRQHRKTVIAEPDESEVKAFMKKACKLTAAHRCLASTALFGFLEHLRCQGVIQAPVPTVHVTATSRLEEGYADFLRNEKGLAELSLRVYLPVATNLLQYLKGKRGGSIIHRLNATMVRNFLFERARERSSESVRLLAISLRSFLRFLHVRGETEEDLAMAVPTVRKWSQTGIPKQLTPAEVNRVLAAPDRKTAIGRRDHAILLLLAKLGLRASEVIALQLSDLRWRTGEILIRGKGSRQDLLPLPQEIGAAIAFYLRRDRRVWPTQRVFLRANAPRVPLTGPASIGHIVRRSFARANVQRPKHIAAHIFRHTLASSMLQNGAKLPDIAEVLRHQSYSSTEIYAKIDLGSLNEVIRPWPISGGAQ